MKKIVKYIKSQVPFEIKRPSSLVSAIVALIITGFFTALGWKLFEWIASLLSPYISPALKTVLGVFAYQFVIKINLASSLLFIVIFVIFFFTIYRYLDKKLLKKGEIIFEDSFDFGNKGWVLNYWGSNDPDKTCRFENSTLVLEAEAKDLINKKGENGAYYDLTSGIYKGSQYEVSCWVRATPSTTMGFKLWAHDTKGKNEIKFPARFYTPEIDAEEIKVGFMGTESLALRIHLHSKAGMGNIIVEKVKVIKIK